MHREREGENRQQTKHVRSSFVLETSPHLPCICKREFSNETKRIRENMSHAHTHSNAAKFSCGCVVVLAFLFSVNKHLLWHAMGIVSTFPSNAHSLVLHLHERKMCSDEKQKKFKRMQKWKHLNKRREENQFETENIHFEVMFVWPVKMHSITFDRHFFIPHLGKSSLSSNLFSLEVSKKKNHRKKWSEKKCYQRNFIV